MNRTTEEIKKGLAELSAFLRERLGWTKRSNVLSDALAYIQQLEEREWELFDLLSSAWFTKACYFHQKDGTVYSRVSGEYMTFDQAIDEFAHVLTEETQLEAAHRTEYCEEADYDCKALGKARKRIAELEAQVPKWTSVEERLPKKNQRVVVTDGKHAWDYGQFNGLAFCFEKDNPNPRKWNWKNHTVRHVEWWMPKETALPEPPKEG